jgi:Protein of unknown function (DUF1236)
MRSKLMIMSAAALLAGTMMAAGQGTPGKGMQGPAAGGGQENSAKPSGQAQDQQKGRAPGGSQIQGKTSVQCARDDSRNQTQRDVSKPSTNGQAPRGDEDRSQSQPQNQRDRDQDRAQDKTQRGRDADRTQGQNNRDQERTQGQSTRDKDAQGQNQPQKGDTQKGDTQRQGAADHQGGSNTTVNLTTEQRTKIRETVLAGSNAPRVSNVTFALNVGTVIPRTVKVVDVPEPLIEIHPEWRGFRYFVYNDEIIVVEPDSLRIVAVVIV